MSGALTQLQRMLDALRAELVVGPRLSHEDPEGEPLHLHDVATADAWGSAGVRPVEQPVRR